MEAQSTAGFGCEPDRIARIQPDIAGESASSGGPRASEFSWLAPVLETIEQVLDHATPGPVLWCICHR
jgi:hypothetical protein